MKILMVCLGNICRSPLAEGILRQKIQQRGLNAVVSSSGTGNYHIGEPADPRMIATALKHDVDISGHRARQFKANDFDRYDIIYVMDDSNYRNVIKLARNDDDKIKIHMIMDVAEPGKNLNVPDPYFSGIEGFELVFDLLNMVCEKIADNIENQI
ncbi:MAG: low molecular weight phosphotyrosine protein phosphatase [Sphingobacteriia bacterium]|nr:low molecular weight phosphotyrosine protein phosphatase [Sphingobacteriia bacterium]